MRVMLATGFYPGDKMGGAEYQTALLARGLAAQGHTVAFLATRTGNEAEYNDQGITVLETSGPHATSPSRHAKALGQLVDRWAPDLCYIRIFADIAPLMSSCRRHDVATVTMSCSGPEASPFLLGHHPYEAAGHLLKGTFYEHWRSFRAIAGSDLHACNTQELSDKIAGWYPHKRIHTVYNGTPLPDDQELHTQPGKQVVWVNNIKRVKRPEWFVELARRLPEYDFVMIGALYPGRYGRAMQQVLDEAPANLHYLGRQPVEAANRIIAQSDLLVYTTRPGYEGFGNSFLQAWMRGVPTISTYTLDGIPEREAIGRCVTNVDSMSAAVEQLMRDPVGRMAMGARARRYAEDHHCVSHMVNAYIDLFAQVARGRSKSPVPAEPTLVKE